MTDRVRLQKFIAASGLCSRRKAEAIILEGRVKVNGTTITKLGTKIDPKIDQVTVDGQLITPPVEPTYLVYYKPRGVLTTMNDPQGRPTILDFLRQKGLFQEGTRVYHVGRLDKESEGLLFLTNDGELTHGLLHPSKKVEKEYIVTVTGAPSKGKIARLERGVTIQGKLTQPCSIEKIRGYPDRTTYRVRLKEGRKRQIRYMFRAIGHKVVRLVRIRLGPVTISGLRPGDVRPLTKHEITALKRAVSCKDRSPSSCKSRQAD